MLVPVSPCRAAEVPVPAEGVKAGGAEREDEIEAEVSPRASPASEMGSAVEQNSRGETADMTEICSRSVSRNVRPRKGRGAGKENLVKEDENKMEKRQKQWRRATRSRVSGAAQSTSVDSVDASGGQESQQFDHRRGRSSARREAK